ncbi:aladin [Beta vulgaris subsp. vulgaris]|uniref:aladin n=1 Tax=Beta vulgaris subsp. vulgaris TaxID=3555 RepID=UPI002036C851|nr:aladin [Beta vulgaris subsp. vulgaris]
MPSFPQPGTVTICEINRDLITSDNLSDDRAKDTYAKLLGVVFSPVQFEPESLSLSSSVNTGDQQGRVPEKGLTALIGAVKRIFHPNDVHLLPEVNLQGVSWHQHKHILAFISGPNQVTIRDYDDAEGKNPSILHGDFQREVKLVEWRPNSGRTLSVACKGGICIWAASYPGNPASVRSGATTFVGSISKGSGTRWTLVDFLKSESDEHISALSWSPDGRYLATGSYESSAFTIWDVSQGHGTPIRRGLGGISILRWSPTGDYFFAAMFDGTFYLWETGTWTFQPWSSSNGFVTGATWDPDGRMILLAFSKSSTLGSVHFASKPPSLVAHLLPVDLPEIVTLTGSQVFEKIAWDASGERLAVSFKGGDELYQGLIAIYDVRRTPLITASLVGFIRGPGDNPKPIAFSFHDKFKQGPLLSVCWSTGFCCTYPLLFRSHILP